MYQRMNDRTNDRMNLRMNGQRRVCSYVFLMGNVSVSEWEVNDWRKEEMNACKSMISARLYCWIEYERAIEWGEKV